MDREAIINAMRGVLGRHKVKEAYIFGSFARKEKGYKDIDIAIVPPEGKFSLLDLVAVERELGEATGKKADVATLRSLKPALLPHIKRDLTAIM